MGRAIALDRLRRGDRVVAIGRSETNARELAEAAAEEDRRRLTFLRADLSTLAENDRVAAEIASSHGAIDALVLCANRHNRARTTTADGLEATFALYYLSRFLLGEALREQLADGGGVVVNVAAPGIKAGSVRWDDLQFERGYRGLKAQLQAGRLNDLLGVGFAAAHGADSPIRYVLFHPGFTRSGTASLSPPARTLIRLLGAVAALSPARAVEPILPLLDDPPHAPLTAIDRGRPVSLDLPTFDPGDARRLRALTEELVSRLRQRGCYSIATPTEAVNQAT